MALTCHVSKIFERVINKQVVAFLESNGLMDPTQHGSRPGRSTLTQLLTQQDRVLRLLEDGGNMDLLYLDSAKAFDKVDLGYLALKLGKLGISGNLLKWLILFTTECEQAVKVGSALSGWSRVISGVPQGSVLAPLLFLLFIGDLGITATDWDVQLLKYVDDTKALRAINTFENVESLQKAMNALYQWQDENNMSWNGAKFQLVRMGPKEDLKLDTLLFTPDFTDPIERVQSAKDLGIIMDEDASFLTQRHAAQLKTKNKASWVLRTFKGCQPSLMKALWKSTIQPHIGYCTQL